MTDHDTPSEDASSPPSTSDSQPPPKTPVKTPSKGKGKAKSINTTVANKDGSSSTAPPSASAKKISGKNKAKWELEPQLDDGEPKPTHWIKAKMPGGPSVAPPVVYTEKELQNIKYNIYQKPEIWKDEEFESDSPAYCLGDVNMRPDNLAHENFWKAVCDLWKTYNIRLWPRIERNAFVITAVKMTISKNTLSPSMNSVYYRLKDGGEQPMACHPLLLSLVLGPEVYAEHFWFTKRWKNRYNLPESSYNSKCAGVTKENMDKSSTTQWIDGKVERGAFAPKVSRKGVKAKKDTSSATSTPRKASAGPSKTASKATSEPSLFVAGDEGGPVQPAPSRNMDLDENYDDDVEEQVLKLKSALKPATNADDGAEQVDPDSSVDSDATRSFIDVATPRSLKGLSPEGEHDDDASLFENHRLQDVHPSSGTLLDDDGAFASPAREDTMDADEPENEDDREAAAGNTWISRKNASKSSKKVTSPPATPSKRKASSIEAPDSDPRPPKRGSYVPFNGEARDRKLLDSVDKFIESYNEMLGRADNELNVRLKRIEYLESWVLQVTENATEREARVSELERLKSDLERQHAADTEQMKTHDTVLNHHKVELGKKDEELDQLDNELKTKEEQIAKKIEELAVKDKELEEEKQKHKDTAAKLEAALAAKPDADATSAEAIPADATADGQTAAAAAARPDEESIKKIKRLRAEIKRLEKDNKSKTLEIQQLTEFLANRNKAAADAAADDDDDDDDDEGDLSDDGF